MPTAAAALDVERADTRCGQGLQHRECGDFTGDIITGPLELSGDTGVPLYALWLSDDTEADRERRRRTGDNAARDRNAV